MKNSFIIVATIICLPLMTSAQSQNWTQLDDFDGLGRVGAFSFIINNKGYVGSGQLNDGTLLNDFWVYDPATDSWSQRQNASGVPRSFAVGFAIGNKGYMGTGEIGGPGNFVSSNDFYEYDPIFDSWNIKQNVGLFGRREATAFVIGNKGYVTLGFKDNWDANNWDKTLYEYDPASNGWTRKADFDANRLRATAAGFSVNGKGYVAGGYYQESLGPIIRRDIQEFDPVVNVWTLKNVFPPNFEIEWPVGFSSGNFGYIVGSDIWNDNNLLNFLKYDPANNSVTIIPKYAFGGFFNFSGLTLCEYAYTVFGNNSRQVWRYFLPEFSITGPSVVCTSGNSFSVNNLSGTFSATWQATPSSLFAVSSGTGSNATLTAASSTVFGQGTITFTISNTCGISPVQIQKQVWVGKPTITFVEKQCHGEEAVFKYAGPTTPGLTYSWSINKPLLDLTTYDNLCYVSGVPGGPPQSYILTLQIQQGNCTVTNTKSGVYSDCPGGGGHLTAYPNPTSSELVVSYMEDYLQTADVLMDETMSIALINAKSEKVYSNNTKSSTIVIPVDKLPEGLYYLQVVNREGVMQRQIRIKR